MSNPRRPYPDLSGIADLDLTGTAHRCPGSDCVACERGSRPERPWLEYPCSRCRAGDTAPHECPDRQPDPARGTGQARSESSGISDRRFVFWWTTRPGSQDNPRTPVATWDAAARWTAERARDLHAFRRNLASSTPTDPPEWLAGLRGAMGRAFARRLADHARGCRFQTRRGTV